MIERAIVAVILIVVGVAAYQLWKAWILRRTESEPLMRDFNLGKPAVVLFTADFCQPCKTQQMPALQRLVDEMDGVQVIEVDVQAEPDLASKWNVLSLPTTFILDKAGKPRNVNYGIASTEKLKQQLESVV